MSIKVKVCGMTDKKEIKKLEKLNIDRIGFINIDRSKRNVSLNKIHELNNVLNYKQTSTLVIEPENPYEVILKANQLGIYNIQLHSLNYSEIRYIQWLNQYHYCENINVTKVIGLHDIITEEKKKEIERYSPFCDNILFDYIKDGKTGGTNTQIPIKTAIKARNIVKDISKSTEVTLAGGLNCKYIEENKEYVTCFDRIDLNSGVEEAPGRKNIDKIKEILDIIET